ncbi:Hint domain-containing protein [Gluconobacter sphaericus]|nr:Hint domain-containing protein [Gluconobacter sphaericus]
MTTITVTSSGNWSGENYNYKDIVLDGTKSAISVNISPTQYSWGDEGSASSPFTSSSLTTKGNVTLTGNGYLTIDGSVTNDGALAVESAHLTVLGTLTGSAITIANGSALTVGTLKTAVTFGASPADSSAYNTLTVTNNAASGVLTLNNLSPRDKIVFNNGATTSLHWSNDGSEILDQNNTVLANVTFAKGYSKDNYSFSGDTVTIVCFLPGSMIRTSKGEVAVEDLQIGDNVIALDWAANKDVSRSVVWAGKAHAVVSAHLPDDEAGWPVRILKNAIADGVPYKDMLITAEHCLFLDGKFVPARMLVNGSSIFYDKSITSYDYYHVETEQHSVITADGMLTESYLDTGNRRSFRQDGKVVSLTPSRALSWNDDAAAPLGVSREFVEPLFSQIEARAKQAAIASQNSAPVLTQESDLRLETSNGMVIHAARAADDRVVFMIPTGVKSVRIVSNASRPSDVIGPFVDDRRYFGVEVGEVLMFESNCTHNITAHLTEGELDGWNTLEQAGTRWTAGNAMLPLGERHPNSIALLALQIKNAGPYVLNETAKAEIAVTA